MVSVNGILKYFLLILVYMEYFVYMLDKAINNYGPYSVNFTKFENCAGPKTRNSTNFAVEIVKIKEDYLAYINITFLAQTRIEEVKIKTYAVEIPQKTLLFNYKTNDPCQHYAFAFIIQKYFRTSKCLIDKGTYIINMNLSNTTRMFYGKSTFYGEFQTKTIVTSKSGNIVCWVVNIFFEKSKEN